MQKLFKLQEEIPPLSLNEFQQEISHLLKRSSTIFQDMLFGLEKLYANKLSHLQVIFIILVQYSSFFFF